MMPSAIHVTEIRAVSHRSKRWNPDDTISQKIAPPVLWVWKPTSYAVPGQKSGAYQLTIPTNSLTSMKFSLLLIPLLLLTSCGQASTTGYYGELRATCSAGDTCCLDSVAAMEKWGFKEKDASPCVGWYRPESHSCAWSKTWCIVDDRPL